MTEKTATVHWQGSGKQGTGQISTETGALTDYPYGFASRFEDDRRGTNPEEILGAAHAACFTMAFSFACEAAGFATSGVDTTASVRLVKQQSGFTIDRIALTLKASIAGIDEVKFQEIAAAAKRDCPVSKALASVAEITLSASLVVPHPNFEAPAEIVADAALPKDEKIALLDAMEQDARQLATASAEGMGGGEPTNLHEVLDAKNALGLPDAYRMVMSDLRARAASGVRDVAVEEALGALDALNSAKVS